MQLYPDDVNFSPNNATIQNPFRSFWMGGYECCDMVNRNGDRVDLLASSGHLENLREDYERLAQFNIRTIREGIRWSKTEPQPYVYDWSDTDSMIIAGKIQGIQQVWDLFHFGMPDDLTPLHPHFVKRFTALCRAFVRHYRESDTETTLIITPINEASFFSWLGGEVACTVPYSRGIGWQVKYELAKAYIAGIKAIKEEDPYALIMSTEPLVDIVPSANATPAQVLAAADAHKDQFHVTDMVCGRICPELGGNDSLLDIIGYNFYYTNRFSDQPGDIVSWINEHNDERFRSLSEIFLEGYARYEKPVILSETSHPGEHRAHWFRHIVEECSKITDENIPFWGVCWYPIIDRRDWDDLNVWHRSGLWDQNEDDHLSAPAIHEELAEALLNACVNAVYM